MTDFPAWLTSTSRALGYSTDSHLARALEISPSTIMRWRNGSRPQVAHLVRMSRLFGARLDLMLVITGHVAPENVQFEASETLSPVSVADHAIASSPLTEDDKEDLRYYWHKRQQEELERLGALISHYTRHAGDEPAQPHWSLAYTATALPQQLRGLLRAMDERRAPKRTRKKAEQ